MIPYCLTILAIIIVPLVVVIWTWGDVLAREAEENERQGREKTSPWLS